MTDVQTNIDFLEGRLLEINEQLAQAHTQSKTNSSPGLLASIRLMNEKKQTILDSLGIWKIMEKVYPNYNR